MGVTHLVTPNPGGGKRLIMPSERDLPDYKKTLTLGADVRTYRNGRTLILPRIGMNDPWGFRVIAVDAKTSIPLVHMHGETYEGAMSEIESELRDLEIIA